MTKSREFYHFKPPIPFQGSWMIDFLSWKVYNSILKINTTNNKFEIFEIYTGPLDTEISFTTLKDKVAEVLDISPEDLEHKILGPDTLKNDRSLSIEKSQTDGYYILLKRYLQS